MNIGEFQFKGLWAIERSIYGTQNGHFTGKAIWSPMAEFCSKYHEQGILRINEQSFDCERDYIFEIHPNKQLVILFADGREFLSLHFSDAKNATARHFCNPDQYQATFELISDLEMRTRITVEGPQKQYEILSSFKFLR